MITVVDTSIWIDHFSGRDPSIRERLLAPGMFVHDFIVGELVLGSIPRGVPVPEEVQVMGRVPTLQHDQVMEFVLKHRLQGTGIGWPDAHILASTATRTARLWTRDRSLLAAAARAGVPA